MIVSRSILLIKRNVSNEVVDKIKSHVLCSAPCLQKLSCLCDNVQKYGKDREAADGNMAARCMLDNKARHSQAHTNAHAHTKICYSCRSSAATMASRTPLIVTL